MKKLLSLFLLLACLLKPVSAEDGSRLWLRQSTDAHAQITAPRQSPTLNIAVNELKQAWKGLPVTLVLKKDKQLSSEGFRIRQVNEKLTVTSPTETGLLYAAYHLIRLQEMRNFGKPSETDLEISSAVMPANLSGTGKNCPARSPTDTKLMPVPMPPSESMQRY